MTTLGKNPTVLFVFFASVFALVNVPVMLLIPGTAMARPGLACAYFAVLALWFAYVVFATLRARREREGLSEADSDQPPAISAERARHQALINQLDFQDAMESSWTDGFGEVTPTRPTADQGRPCAVYPVELQGARDLPKAFEVGPAADWCFRAPSSLDSRRSLSRPKTRRARARTSWCAQGS